jgi:hypothetical protein
LTRARRASSSCWIWRASAQGLVAIDLKYGAPLSPPIEVRDGDCADLAGAALVMIIAGGNEKTGGATDRNDAQGRLQLLHTNAHKSPARTAVRQGVRTVRRRGVCL